jgi:hypothetical protein
VALLCLQSFALDPSDPNYMQIVVVVIPTIPPAGPAPGVPQTVINAWNAVQGDGAQVIGYEEALYTTLNRAADAKAGLTAFPCQKLALLCCCVNGDVMEGRGDNVGGLNLGRSLDKPC